MSTDRQWKVAGWMVLALALAWAIPAAAQERGADRSGKWADLERGASFVSRGKTYILLPGVRASATAPGSEAAAGSRALAIPAAEILETKGAFVIHKALPVASSRATFSRAGETVTYPVALNPRTGQLCVLSGSLVAKLRDIADSAAVAATHGVQELQVFPRLGYASFQVAPGQDLVEALAALSSDARVESAYLDIVEHIKQPK